MEGSAAIPAALDFKSLLASFCRASLYACALSCFPSLFRFFFLPQSESEDEEDEELPHIHSACCFKSVFISATSFANADNSSCECDHDQVGHQLRQALRPALCRFLLFLCLLLLAAKDLEATRVRTRASRSAVEELAHDNVTSGEVSLQATAAAAEQLRRRSFPRTSAGGGTHARQRAGHGAHLASRACGVWVGGGRPQARVPASRYVGAHRRSPRLHTRDVRGRAPVPVPRAAALVHEPRACGRPAGAATDDARGVVAVVPVAVAATTPTMRLRLLLLTMMLDGMIS
eukprot:scaffold3148_cov343-Prasinococcus_capsulatus_cf.AAC.3